MKINIKLNGIITGVSALTLGLAAAVFTASSVNSTAAPANSPAPPSTNSTRIKFLPPAKAAAAVRVTGGSRGTGDTATRLDVLAPDQVGLTTQEQPSLFWFQSQPSQAKFELTVLEENKVKPLLQFNVDRAGKAGIQRLKLSDHGVKLAPGVEYQWVVALITDSDNRSSDQIASGVIQRVDPSQDLKTHLAQAAPMDKAETYAQAGIWYDALAALSDQIEAHPQDPNLHQARADLLRQVGLAAAAKAESELVAK